MEVHRFTYRIILLKNELESAHTSPSDHSLVEIWMGGGIDVLNNPRGMWSAKFTGWILGTKEWVFSTNKLWGLGCRKREKRNKMIKGDLLKSDVCGPYLDPDLNKEQTNSLKTLWDNWGNVTAWIFADIMGFFFIFRHITVFTVKAF